MSTAEKERLAYQQLLGGGGGAAAAAAATAGLSSSVANVTANASVEVRSFLANKMLDSAAAYTLIAGSLARASRFWSISRPTCTSSTAYFLSSFGRTRLFLLRRQVLSVYFRKQGR